MREYICPKEVPIGDLSYVSLGFIQSQAFLEGPWNRLFGLLFAPRGRTHPWYLRLYMT